MDDIILSEASIEDEEEKTDNKHDEDDTKGVFCAIGTTSTGVVVVGGGDIGGVISVAVTSVAVILVSFIEWIWSWLNVW